MASAADSTLDACVTKRLVRSRCIVVIAIVSSVGGNEQR
jgi:hypothetical protein